MSLSPLPAFFFLIITINMCFPSLLACQGAIIQSFIFSDLPKELWQLYQQLPRARAVRGPAVPPLRSRWRLSLSPPDMLITGSKTLETLTLVTFVQFSESDSIS